MGTFEQIAISDLKFRVVLAASSFTWIGISLLTLFVFKSKVGFVVGVIPAVIVAYLTAKRLSFGFTSSSK